jgi:hypothetical protein
VGRESGVSVRYDLSGESEPFVDVVEVQLSNLWSCYCSVAWQEYGGSGASVVYDGEDRIISFAFGQSRN